MFGASLKTVAGYGDKFDDGKRRNKQRATVYVYCVRAHLKAWKYWILCAWVQEGMYPNIVRYKVVTNKIN